MEYTIFKILIIGTIGMLVLAIALIVFVVIYQRRMMNQELLMQEREAEYQRQLLLATIASQEEERRRVARDLHDEVGAMLSTTRLYLAQLQRSVTDNEKLSGVATQTKQLLDDSIQTVRRISKDLMPTTLDQFGFAAAMEEIAQKMSGTDKMKVYWKQLNIAQHFSKEIELALFRATQEVLNNAIKHSQATEISIELSGNSMNTHQMRISDNGKGFDVAAIQATKGGGIGLKSIESRLTTVGCGVRWHSQIGKGTEIVIDIPS